MKRRSAATATPSLPRPQARPSRARAHLQQRTRLSAIQPAARLHCSAVTSLRIVADEGYHKSLSIRERKEAGFRSVIPERAIHCKRSWADKDGRLTALAFYQNEWRNQRAAGKRWLRKRAELVERSFATTCDTGVARRTRPRGLHDRDRGDPSGRSAMSLARDLRKPKPESD